jgi:hypothetical protein
MGLTCNTAVIYAGYGRGFREALRYEPADPVATFGLAESLEKLGKRDDAREAYQTYLIILPNSPSAAEAKKALKRLRSPSSSGHRKESWKRHRSMRNRIFLNRPHFRQDHARYTLPSSG